MTRRRMKKRALMRGGMWVTISLLVLTAQATPASAGAPPSISDFSPTSGPTGTSVTINGSNLAAAFSVKFNGASAGFSVNGPGTQITATVPGGATTGPISVSTPDGTAVTGANFTVTNGGPTISGFTPTSGPVGTWVTINGTNFAGASVVRFNGTNAPGFTVNGGGTQITVMVPSGAHTGKISVTTPSGFTRSSTDFTVTTPNGPNISSFSPTFGAVGTTVTIHGDHFTGVTEVKFHGTGASFAFDSDSQITATVPTGATTGKITVTTPGGTATSATGFTVVTMTFPKVTGFSPHSGVVGTSVSIYGSGFLGTTTVRFNGTPVGSFTLVTNGKITTTVPSGASSGPITVTNPMGTAASGASFTVTGPRISSFSPTSGYPGTTVTIYGSNFTGVTGVRFNGMSAVFSFVNSGTVSTIVPNGATSGAISLTTPSGTSTSSGSFTVLAPHQRTVSLSLSHRRLFAIGRVSVNDGYSSCAAYVPVVIQRRHHGRWHWVTTTSTQQDGTFRALVSDRPGLYRAKAKRIQLVNGAICTGAASNIAHHG